MSTFSINIGLNTEATSYPLVSTGDVDFILNKLIDNESKLINPWDLRDAILSVYSSSGFKLTNTVVSTKEYIGIDTLNNSDRDIKKLILLGKRAFSGTYSYTGSHDILSTFSFSSDDTDIYFFNTKLDSVSNGETKIKILSGTPGFLHTSAPYIRTQVITSTSSISMDFINSSIGGNISITSDYGSVSINDISFPTVAESYASASNDKVLLWEDGKLGWSDIAYEQLSYVGATGTELNMYGQPFNVNGFGLELQDTRWLPKGVNDMIIGQTFSFDPISNVLKKIIYPYLPPLCSIKILAPYNKGFAEVGTYPSPVIEFSITKRTNPTSAATLVNMIPGVYTAIVAPGEVFQSSTSNGVVILPINTTPTVFEIQVTDGIQPVSASVSIQGIYPYFYGFSNLSVMDNTGLGSLTKLVDVKSDKTIDVTGSGNLYFIYDDSYGLLTDIIDWNGSSAFGSFSHTSVTFNSPTGIWSGKIFHVYQYNGLPQLGPPDVNFQFKY